MVRSNLNLRKTSLRWAPWQSSKVTIDSQIAAPPGMARPTLNLLKKSLRRKMAMHDVNSSLDFKFHASPQNRHRSTYVTTETSAHDTFHMPFNDAKDF